MNRSLNEIDALARRATRGAGFSWGVSEEAGRITRALFANGMDGCAALASYLKLRAEDPQSFRRSIDFNELTNVSDLLLCPLQTAAMLSDYASSFPASGLTLRNVAVPVLLLPATGIIAQKIGTTVSATWEGHRFLTNAPDTFLADQKCQGSGIAADEVELRLLPAKADINTMRKTRANPKDSDLTILNEFADRTYAPATEASRRLGAGSAETDND